MKRPVIETFLSKLDDRLRWTGIPAMVAAQMSDDPSVNRKQRPLRWIPLWPIAFSCGLFILSLTWEFAVYLVSFSGISVSLLPIIVMNGPLGRPAYEDDEREAALRKDSHLFCFGLLAALNCVGQPILMILSRWQHWDFPHIVSVGVSALMLNGTLFGSLPTLYASWSLRRLPNE